MSELNEGERGGAESVEVLRNKLYEKAEELSNDPKAVFEFPGISERQLALLEAEESELPPGYFTPIRDIITKCTEQGIRVYVTDNPRNHEVFIIPARDASEQADSLRLHYFDHETIQEGELARVVKLAHDVKQAKRASMS